MEIEKSAAIYRTGLFAGIVWNIAQAIEVRNNIVLLLASLGVLAITIGGSWLTITEEGKLQNIWMLLYVLPAALIAFGAAQGYYEAQNSLLRFGGIEQISSPIPGKSADYSEAVTSHYLSMLVPPVSWALAYLLPLLARLCRRAKL